MKVQADCINGNYKVDEFEDGVDIVDEQFFYNYLDDLGEDETIGAELSEEMAAKINAEYGIH